MGLFKKKSKDDDNKLIKSEKYYYNLADLEKKVRDKVPMTSDEFDALQRERMKDVMNKVLRIFGVCALLFVVVLAIGAFLYPYSLFNLFGSGDKFYDCWNHIQYHLPKEDIEVIYGEDAASYIKDGWGWVSITKMMDVAFQNGTSPKLNFLVLGAWSIILVATLGMVMVIIFAAYVTAYNIKDLILVIRHIGKQGAAVISDVAITAAQSVEAGTANSQLGKKKNQPKKTSTKKRPGEKDLFADDDSIVNEVKAEPETVKEEPYSERRSEGSSEISSEDLDRLLSGEDIGRKL